MQKFETGASVMAPSHIAASCQVLRTTPNVLFGPSRRLDGENKLKAAKRVGQVTTISVDDILSAVGRTYHVTTANLKSPKRMARGICMPRQVAMYLAEQLTGRTFADIGQRIGKRDHTTVLHGVHKIEAMIKDDDMLAVEISDLMQQLQDDAEQDEQHVRFLAEDGWWGS